ncbi:MAG: hypothetical protein AAF211_23615 [Myxococcota bacterium]
MYELKKIRPDTVDKALAKAAHYRLLNLPRPAECICLDVLEVEPNHQAALALLVRALTDQFADTGVAVSRTKVEDIVRRLEDPYERIYHQGLIMERRGIAAIRGGTPGHLAFGWFDKAMALYDEASGLAPDGNDDAVLRYNTCARILNCNPDIRPQEHGSLHMTE